MWLQLSRHGIRPETIVEWTGTTWWPELRWCDEVQTIEVLCDELVDRQPGETWADPQLLMRFPDYPNPRWRPAFPHVDELPPWALPDERYRVIVGVALTASTIEDGCVWVWPGPEPVELAQGDVLLLDPETPHCSGLNAGASVRCALYLRLLSNLVDPIATPCPTCGSLNRSRREDPGCRDRWHRDL